MTTIQHNGNTIELYDSIETMPMANHIEFNRAALIDGGIGGDLDAVSGHISTIAQAIRRGDTAKAGQVLENYAMCLQFIVAGATPEMAAFAALVHSINGRAYDCPTELEAVRAKLLETKATAGMVKNFLASVKKKFTANLKRTPSEAVDRHKPTTPSFTPS